MGAKRMSEEVKDQYKIILTASCRVRLDTMAGILGFSSSNALVSTFANELAGVPPEKVWEVLAEIRRYHPRKKGGQSSC
ncbi:hypothetical protein Ga0100231_006240 [Opitutaceae bacterium TAV4]|nr:hypothetical protein Ga0100231_006240 [Opitutaceae bacterium TAV4]RRK02866.1 hypothetical protein Ga0100230_005685 [Opitutaceae bacterium TAV3]